MTLSSPILLDLMFASGFLGLVTVLLRRVGPRARGTEAWGRRRVPSPAANTLVAHQPSSTLSAALTNGLHEAAKVTPVGLTKTLHGDVGPSGSYAPVASSMPNRKSDHLARRHSATTEMARLQTIVDKAVDRAEAMSSAQAQAQTQVAAAEASLDRLLADLSGCVPGMAAKKERAQHLMPSKAPERTAAAPSDWQRAA